MGSFFGKRASPKLSQKDAAVLDLKRQRDRLKQYTVKIEKVLAKETELARAHVQKKEKAKAMLFLKRKKYQVTLLSRTEGQLQNIQEMLGAIDFAAEQQAVFRALEAGNSVLQEINSQTSMEDVDKLMAETAEAIEFQQQVGERLGQSLSLEDDEAVLAELETIMAAEADEKVSQESDEKVSQESNEDVLHESNEEVLHESNEEVLHESNENSNDLNEEVSQQSNEKVLENEIPEEDVNFEHIEKKAKIRRETPVLVDA